MATPTPGGPQLADHNRQTTTEDQDQEATTTEDQDQEATTTEDQDQEANNLRTKTRSHYFDFIVYCKILPFFECASIVGLCLL